MSHGNFFLLFGLCLVWTETVASVAAKSPPLVSWSSHPASSKLADAVRIASLTSTGQSTTPLLDGSRSPSAEIHPTLLVARTSSEGQTASTAAHSHHQGQRQAAVCCNVLSSSSFLAQDDNQLSQTEPRTSYPSLAPGPWSLASSSPKAPLCPHWSQAWTSSQLLTSPSACASCLSSLFLFPFPSLLTSHTPLHLPPRFPWSLLGKLS